jgi:hypothetical protein
MGSYVNVGAVKLADRSPILTKKALKALLADEPGEVLFFNTALGLGPGNQEYRADELDPQYSYQVCGPDPYTSRKWYATVAVRDGKAVVTT